MALLQDLIRQINDPTLRDRILQETDKLMKQKKFGLVFEEHLPECTPLHDVPIRVGSKVALKTGYVSDIYMVIKLDGNEALCDRRETHEKVTFQLDEIVAIAEFGEPIYPTLKPLDAVQNAPDSDLWHTLIEADNYHALQLLEYLYAEKVDCIYIDPPYNTGAKDWKYNNDYVDSSDAYRHSKWLSMMEKRLKIAKKLLNPNDSVLIVTIDEKEYLHLGCLLEEIFPEARMQMITSRINKKASTRVGQFARCDEYGRENAPYAPFFCPADSRRATLRQRNRRKQEEANAVARQILGAYGQKMPRSGARRERQRNRTRPHPAEGVQGDDPPDQAEGQAGRIAFRRQCVQCQGESSRNRRFFGQVYPGCGADTHDTEKIQYGVHGHDCRK